MNAPTTPFPVASAKEAFGKKPNNAAQRLLSQMSPGIREDILIRGMGGSVTSIRNYFEEMGDVEKATATMVRIDRAKMSPSERESQARSMELAAQKKEALLSFRDDVQTLPSYNA